MAHRGADRQGHDRVPREGRRRPPKLVGHSAGANVALLVAPRDLARSSRALSSANTAETPPGYAGARAAAFPRALELVQPSFGIVGILRGVRIVFAPHVAVATIG